MFQVWALIFSSVEELEVSERRSTVIKAGLWGLENRDLLIGRYKRTRGDILRRSRRKLLSDLTWRMQFDTLLISSDTIFRLFRSYEKHFDVRRIWYSTFGLKEKVIETERYFFDIDETYSMSIVWRWRSGSFVRKSFIRVSSIRKDKLSVLS